MATEQTRKDLTLDKAGALEEREKAERAREISEADKKSRVSDDDGAARTEQRHKDSELSISSQAEQKEKSAIEQKGKGDRTADHAEEKKKADIDADTATTSRAPKVI